MLQSDGICVIMTLSIPTTVLIVGACTFGYSASMHCVEVPCRPVNLTCVVDGCALPYPGHPSENVTVSIGGPCDFDCAGRKEYARSGSIVLVCVGGGLFLLVLLLMSLFSKCTGDGRVYPSEAPAASVAQDHSPVPMDGASFAARAVVVYNGSRLGECTICLEAVESDASVTPCNHVFHGDCLQRWLQVKTFCPNCLQKVSMNNK